MSNDASRREKARGVHGDGAFKPAAWAGEEEKMGTTIYCSKGVFLFSVFHKLLPKNELNSKISKNKICLNFQDLHFSQLDHFQIQPRF